VHTLDNQIRPEDTHRGDTDTRLGSSVCGAETCEDDGAGAAHGAKEGLLKCQQIHHSNFDCIVFGLDIAIAKERRRGSDWGRLGNEDEVRRTA
jgi:hypothetical protein